MKIYFFKNLTYDVSLELLVQRTFLFPPNFDAARLKIVYVISE